MQAGIAAGSQELNNAQARNNGQQTGLLGGPGAIDGTATSFWNQADPFNTLGHSSSGHALSNIFDPGNIFGMNQAANPNSQAGAGSNMFPNLGAASLIPKMPVGAFVPIHNGTGIYNNMAAQGAGGMTFNPQAQMPHNLQGPSGGNKPVQGVNSISSYSPAMTKQNPNIRKR